MNTIEAAAVCEASIVAQTSSPELTQADWDARYAVPYYIWTTEADRMVKSETRPLTPGTALDLACGEGRNAVWLASIGWDVRAVDFSQMGLRKARLLAAQQLIPGRVDFVQADLRRFEPGLHCYDFVLMSYLQLPVGELAPLIKRAARAVAPGGTFLLLGHDASGLQAGSGGPRHAELLYTAEQVASVLSGELVIERAQRIRRRVGTATGPRTSIDCVVRAHRSI